MGLMQSTVTGRRGIRFAIANKLSEAGCRQSKRAEWCYDTNPALLPATPAAGSRRVRAAGRLRAKAA